MRSNRRLLSAGRIAHRFSRAAECDFAVDSHGAHTARIFSNEPWFIACHRAPTLQHWWAGPRAEHRPLLADGLLITCCGRTEQGARDAVHCCNTGSSTRRSSPRCPRWHFLLKPGKHAPPPRPSLRPRLGSVRCGASTIRTDRRGRRRESGRLALGIRQAAGSGRDIEREWGVCETVSVFLRAGV